MVDEQERPGRTSITWWLPSPYGLKLTYTGKRKPYGEWVLATWRAALSAYKVYLTVLWSICDMPGMTWKRVDQIFLEVIKHALAKEGFVARERKKGA